MMENLNIFRKAVRIITAMVICSFGACTEEITYTGGAAVNLPVVEAATAEYLWIGPDYKLAVDLTVKCSDELQSVQALVSEWNVDTTISVSGTEYHFCDTFLVTKDANNTQHEVELEIRNVANGVLRTKISVDDLTATNQIAGYQPDILPPTVTITAPTKSYFYGFKPAPVAIDVAADITEDVELTSFYMKVWGETLDGVNFEVEDSWTPTNDAEKLSFSYTHHVELPGGEYGEYQFLMRATDASGNQTVTGGNLIVGQVDRLYLSDAKNEAEVINQGFDAGAAVSAWGLGTLLPMTKVSNNVFKLDYYYRNDADENIRFIAFQGSDRPFRTSSPRGTLYTLDGENVLGHTSGAEGSVTGNLAESDFKLPVSGKGYYTITVDVTQRTISIAPMFPDGQPTNPEFSNTALFPNYSIDNPYPYLAVIAGGSVEGTSGWAEVAGNTALTLEVEHPFHYSGTLKTKGGGNISLIAPKDRLLPAANTSGWIRLPAARANMKDTYGDLISQLKPIGASSNGANYGIGLTANSTWQVSYDLITYRVRAVKQ